MKLVPLRETPTIKATEIIKIVLEQPSPPQMPGQAQGFGASDILSRSRVLKALRTSITPAGMLLEDADHKTLVDALNGFRFGLASEDLAQIITDIQGAKDAPVMTAQPSKVAAA